MLCPKCNYNNPFGNYCVKCGSLLKDKSMFFNKPKTYGDAKKDSENQGQRMKNQFPNNMRGIYKSQNILNSNRKSL